MQQKRALHEWIAVGRRNGVIEDVRTAVWAYCMDERRACAWIADIVTGKMSEREALEIADRALRLDDALAELV